MPQTAWYFLQPLNAMCSWWALLAWRVFVQWAVEGGEAAGERGVRPWAREEGPGAAVGTQGGGQRKVSGWWWWHFRDARLFYSMRVVAKTLGGKVKNFVPDQWWYSRSQSQKHNSSTLQLDLSCPLEGKGKQSLKIKIFSWCLGHAGVSVSFVQIWL